MFPESIKKLLKGLKDGRKRGLFILITFFRSLNYTPEEINNRIREWNKLNPVPLKEGYVKSQIDWHLKQKRKILPPNYENDAFYKDLGIIDKRPDAKNPLVELKRNMKKGR
jgi:DNA-binding transcriptional ArsR family regulator